MISVINSHKTSYKKLLEEMKNNQALKGSFTINWNIGKGLFFSDESQRILLTKFHSQFDINEVEGEDPNIYNIYSRRMKKQ